MSFRALHLTFKLKLNQKKIISHGRRIKAQNKLLGFTPQRELRGTHITGAIKISQCPKNTVLMLAIHQTAF